MWGDEVLEPEPLTSAEVVCRDCHLAHNRSVSPCPNCEGFGRPANNHLELVLYRWHRENRAALTLATRHRQDEQRLVRV